MLQNKQLVWGITIPCLEIKGLQIYNNWAIVHNM